jgi:hypothetical protein
MVEAVDEEGVAVGADPFDRLTRAGQMRREQQGQRNPALRQLRGKVGATIQCPGANPGQGHHQTCGHPPIWPDADEGRLKRR